MACVFPKAPDLATFWRNISGGVDAITDAPPQRLDPRFFEAGASAPDRFNACRGGFIDDYAQFDAAAFGIMPIAAQGAEPDQLLALKIAVEAVADAGYAERPFARKRTSVIIGRGNYLGPGFVRLVNITRGAQQIVDALHDLLPELSAERLTEIKQAFQARSGVFGGDTAIGLVPNLTASRIANRLDLGGAAYTVDAACASTLVAVDRACRALATGEDDVVIAGGVHLCHDPAFWSVFSQLGALSRSQQIRPFDRRADGLLIGEGIGMLVLKRLADARRADDRIYAVIRGSGIASDGRDVSLMTPGVEGQLLALERAWQSASLDPATVGLIEAHGTATVAGDAAELETLARFFGPLAGANARVPMGSVKSMIGHAMPAAGAAGLIKAALAVYHGVRPPALHCEDPHPALAATRFRAIAAGEPWDDGPRRAAVNAFGFGGINAHVIVDAPDASKARRRSARADAAAVGAAAALTVAASTQAGLLAALDAGSSGGEGAWRLAVIDPTPARLAKARAAVEAGRPRHGRDGIFFSPTGLVTVGGKVALLFPGVEANFAPQVEDIARRFDLAPPAVDAGGLAGQGAGVMRLNDFLRRVTQRVGIVPDAIAGHSIGEWSGMHAAGVFGDMAAEDIGARLEPGSLRIADASYVAVGAGGARALALVGDLEGVVVSHDNCPHQSILCAPDRHVDEISLRLRAQRILFELLPFRSGFHSPALAAHVGHYAQVLAELPLHPPTVPLWSATTCAPYPDDPERIVQLFSEHLVRPVRFRELIKALHADGVRVFVQVGSGSLAAFVDDVLAGSPHHAVSLVSAQRPGMAQLRQACAALWVEGVGIDLVKADLAAPKRAAGTSASLSLALGVPLIRLGLPPLTRPSMAVVAPGAGANPVLAALAENLEGMAAAQQAIVRAFAATAVTVPERSPVISPVPALVAPLARTEAGPAEHTEQLLLGVENYPELLDHCLIPQPPGWPTLADRAPTVPMTMSIALMMEAAQRLDPRRVVVAIEEVLASAWLRAEPPADVAITSRRIDADRIHVRIGNHVEGTVTMATGYPDPPPVSDEAIMDARPFPIAAEAVYRDGWLFHGPGYQGVAGIDLFGSNGLAGQLRALPAKGALLDAAGQLAGLWVMVANDHGRMTMPIRARRIELHGPGPEEGEIFACRVWIRHLGRNNVRADLELVREGRVHARVTGWEDWRFQTDGGLFELMHDSGHRLLATLRPEGFALLVDPGWTSATIDYLAWRYLAVNDVTAVGGLRAVQRKRDWLMGRIAAKDALRARLFERGVESVFPIEVGIANDAQGRPLVTLPGGVDLRVSIAHKPGVACAIVAEGVDPGIDIERVEARSESMVALAFARDELALLPEGDRDEWLTRFWCAKEAAGKARGSGLAGNPRGLAVLAVAGERLRVEGRWVETRRLGEHVIAWTVQ